MTGYLDVGVFPVHHETGMQLCGGQISPRGIVVTCSQEQLRNLHQMGDDQQAKYDSMRIEVRLNFNSGEQVTLESDARIQSIRRASQLEYEISMSFLNMMQDGYRHIARYLRERQTESV